MAAQTLAGHDLGNLIVDAEFGMPGSRLENVQHNQWSRRVLQVIRHTGKLVGLVQREAGRLAQRRVAEAGYRLAEVLKQLQK